MPRITFKKGLVNLRMTGDTQIRATLRKLEGELPKGMALAVGAAGNKIRDRAKQLLEDASAAKGKKYWTGKLKRSIKTELVEGQGIATAGKTIGFVVGPDLGTVPYAGYVEVGHRTRSGGRWFGYHYMENAFTQLSGEVMRDIEKAVEARITEIISGKIGVAREARKSLKTMSDVDWEREMMD